MTSPARISPAAEGTKAQGTRGPLFGIAGPCLGLGRRLGHHLLHPGGQGRLLGIDHLQMLNPPLAAFAAHHPGQGADRGVVDVRHLKAGGIQLVARPHGADDGHPRLFGLHHQGQLAGDGVDGVHHIAVLGEIKLSRGVGGVKGLVGPHHDVGVNVPNPGGGYVHLVLAQGGAGGDDLAVQVAEADLVVVDQIQGPHPAAGQGLHHIASYASHAKDGHPGLAELVQPRLAQPAAGCGNTVLLRYLSYRLVLLEPAQQGGPLIGNVLV